MKTNIRRGTSRGSQNTFGDFVCIVCHNFVSVESALSGVNNRNHCPYCLCSRHLDLFRAGDRLSACKAPMRAIALTLKRSPKKYAGANPGEIMLVHLCVECGSISLNRVAADDDVHALLETFEGSRRLDARTTTAFAQIDVIPLDTRHRSLVHKQLLGHA